MPHSFELGDVQWHLVTLICLEDPLSPSCQAVTSGLQSMAPLRRVAFLHGQNGKEWFLEDGALLELRTAEVLGELGWSESVRVDGPISPQVDSKKYIKRHLVTFFDGH